MPNFYLVKCQAVLPMKAAKKICSFYFMTSVMHIPHKRNWNLNHLFCSSQAIFPFLSKSRATIHYIYCLEIDGIFIFFHDVNKTLAIKSKNKKKSKSKIRSKQKQLQEICQIQINYPQSKSKEIQLVNTTGKILKYRAFVSLCIVFNT
mgnify:CR=1 FL=1